MKTIVFGGSGFLGSHVADALSNAGHEVYIFDIKKSPYLSGNQKMIVGDIMDEQSVARAISACEVVYNFAGIADINEAQARPIDTVKHNILGNIFLLEAARKTRVKRFVFASSVYVYSKSGSFYRSSKQACELFIENYNKVYNLPYTILRFGSLYGPRADKRNGLYRLLHQAVTEKKVVYHGSEEDVREYIHVVDAARCAVEILVPEYENQHVIISGNQPMKFGDLLVMIKEIMGNKIEIKCCSSDSDLHYSITPYTFNPNIAKKMVSHHYHDLGQGFLNCLNEIHNKVNNKYHKEMGFLIPQPNKDKK